VLVVSGIELVEDEVEQDGAAETASAWPATAATAAPPRLPVVFYSRSSLNFRK